MDDELELCSFQDVDEIDEDGDPHFVDCDRPARYGVLRPAQTWSDAQYACCEHLGDICEFDGQDKECIVTDLKAPEPYEGAAPSVPSVLSVDDDWNGEEPF